ncbi:MAG: hypothetical protein MMC33_007155 [Icmadophila ericetorum]|nr:hypothetical protein [Icmadophila ericetorum]
MSSRARAGPQDIEHCFVILVAQQVVSQKKKTKHVQSASSESVDLESHSIKDAEIFTNAAQGRHDYIFYNQSQSAGASSSSQSIPRNIPTGSKGTSAGSPGQSSGPGTSYTYSTRTEGNIDGLNDNLDGLTVSRSSRWRQSDTSRSYRDQQYQVSSTSGYGPIQYVTPGQSPSSAQTVTGIDPRPLQCDSLLTVIGYPHSVAYTSVQYQQAYTPTTQQTYIPAASTTPGPSTVEPQPLDDVETQDDSVSGSIVRGGKGNGEMLLDPEYQMITEPWKFFKPGKVFATLWWESSGETSNKNSASVVKYAGESAYVKIRRFIVVKPNIGEYYSKCLAISTYEGRATLKKGLNAKKHTIVYTGDNAPDKLPGEKINKQPIKVQGVNSTRKLDERSRVNLAKTYPVEHNVKVMEIGNVVGSSLKILTAYWKEMLED